MAHNLDFQTGTPAFVSLKQNAWHGLGTVVEDNMSVAEAIKLAKLDFIVNKAPNTHHMPAGIGLNGEPLITEVVSEKSFFTYRADTNFVLGDRLGSTYHVIQNEEALSVCDLLVANGGLVIESAGSINNGKTVFMCCRLQDDVLVGGVDRVKQYLVIATGHDGNTPLLGYFTDVRVVCDNTLQMSMRGATQKHSIRHTRNAENRLNEALKLMGLAMKNTAVSQAAFDKMAQTKLSQEQFWNYLGNIYFTAEESKALINGQKPAEVISTRKTNIINGVLNFANNGIGQAEANPGSAWWAYNAVTGYYSNMENESADNRMSSLLWGSQAKTMERALVLAENPSNIVSLKPKGMQLKTNVFEGFNLN